MDEVIPLPRELEYEVWRNVKKLGSELVQVVSIDIPNLASGQSFETPLIDTTGWLGITLGVYSDGLLQVNYLCSPDGTTLIEHPAVYTPPNLVCLIQRSTILRYFKIRVTNLSPTSLTRGKINIVLRAYPFDYAIFPKRVTLFTFTGTLTGGSTITSPVFDMGFVENAYLTIYSLNANINYWIYGSPDNVTWYLLTNGAVYTSQAQMITIDPPLRYLRFSLSPAKNTTAYISFSIQYKI